MAMTVNVWARYALYVLFLLPGLTMATWVTRTPALRDGLSAKRVHRARTAPQTLTVIAMTTSPTLTIIVHLYDGVYHTFVR